MTNLFPHLEDWVQWRVPVTKFISPVTPKFMYASFVAIYLAEDTCVKDTIDPTTGYHADIVSSSIVRGSVGDVMRQTCAEISSKHKSGLVQPSPNGDRSAACREAFS